MTELRMSTLTYKFFQALLQFHRMYVTFWGIVSASNSPDNQFLHVHHDIVCHV